MLRLILMVHQLGRMIIFSHFIQLEASLLKMHISSQAIPVIAFTMNMVETPRHILRNSLIVIWSILILDKT